MALTKRTQQLILEHFIGIDLSNKIAIDATCGNGNDIEFLAQMKFKKVLGFDVQPRALQITQQRLSDLKLSNTKLILDGHENLKKHIETEIECVMFNLGYMPNADKTITTTESTSITAIESSLDKLSTTGLISVLCYPGHPQGAQETKSIQQKLALLDANWHVNEVVASHPGPRAPILYLVNMK